MITITEKYGEAKIFAENIESGAEGQIRQLLRQNFVEGSKIRIMPDVHAGAGCAIGTTMTITDKVVPNLVGVDIGCGMETIMVRAGANGRVDLHQLDSLIHQAIPAGMEVRDKPHKFIVDARLDELHCAKHVNIQRGELSLGTLGGGNHFIELDKDEDNNLYLVIHSGSRNIGLQVATYYQDEAFKARKDGESVPYELAYCEGDLLEDYLHDMAIMQEFAHLNRRAIANDIIRSYKFKEEDSFSTIHNYIDLDNHILRKGAVSAQAREMLLIPINMRDGAFLCEGLGNADWNFSAPHGAGRLMSRSEAKASFTLNAFKKEMAGVFSTTVNAETLDECPMAYKSMEDILSQIAPTAKVIKHIKPIYNFKSAEQTGKGGKKHGGRSEKSKGKRR